MWGKGYVHRVPRLRRGWGIWRNNVRPEERWLSVALGLGLALLGLRRRQRSGSLAMMGAGWLMRRGLTGKCPAYRRLGLTSV